MYIAVSGFYSRAMQLTEGREKGGTGYGLDEHVREAYGFLAHNYHPGDSIHLLGFSRGAYTARSVCGLVCTVGLLTKKGMDDFHTIWHDYTQRKITTNPEYDSHPCPSIVLHQPQDMRL